VYHDRKSPATPYWPYYQTLAVIAKKNKNGLALTVLTKEMRTILILTIVLFELSFVGCKSKSRSNSENKVQYFDSIKELKTRLLTHNKWKLYRFENKNEKASNKIVQNLIFEFREDNKVYVNNSKSVGVWKANFYLHPDNKHISTKLKLELNDTIEKLHIPHAFYYFGFYGENKDILRFVMERENGKLERHCSLTFHSLNE